MKIPAEQYDLFDRLPPHRRGMTDPRPYLLAHAKEEFRELVERGIARSKLRETGCLEFQGALAEGYGVIGKSKSRRQMLLHRLAALALGWPLGPELCVLHHCDNRQCWNPGHLFVGSKGDNARDAVKKGRWPRQRLSIEDAKAIRARWATGERQADIGADFGISASYVCSIGRGHRWSEHST